MYKEQVNKVFFISIFVMLCTSFFSPGMTISELIIGLSTIYRYIIRPILYCSNKIQYNWTDTSWKKLHGSKQ